MKCEKCGKEINSLDVHVFDYEGYDLWHSEPLTEIDDAVYVDTSTAWVGYEMYDTDEERSETIECPYCHKFPFKHIEVQEYKIIRLVMFKEETRKDN